MIASRTAPVATSAFAFGRSNHSRNAPPKLNLGSSVARSNCARTAAIVEQFLQRMFVRERGKKLVIVQGGVEKELLLLIARACR